MFLFAFFATIDSVILDELNGLDGDEVDELDGEWIGNGKRPPSGSGCPFFLALKAIFAGGPVARLRKSTISAGVEVQADGLSACENMIWPPRKSLFLVVRFLREHTTSTPHTIYLIAI
ncbi:Os01g0709100 [Oryza sativa Japonica Group]|uniref:Os01g0709100 protein n=1 Tax=Oryza sativa subsp. japonica TaxID=39947 RepID=A0A0P0V789_ORYSJ|nr:Os01g0709100 [Oryza sativa Japonica Group]